MPELIVLEKIDGNPVAWRCSHCRQRFSAYGKLTTQERHRKVTAEFEAHMGQNHNNPEFDCPGRSRTTLIFPASADSSL
jgi:hypothetical protein